MIIAFPLEVAPFKPWARTLHSFAYPALRRHILRKYSGELELVSLDFPSLSGVVGQQGPPPETLSRLATWGGEVGGSGPPLEVGFRVGTPGNGVYPLVFVAKQFSCTLNWSPSSSLPIPPSRGRRWLGPDPPIEGMNFINKLQPFHSQNTSKSMKLFMRQFCYNPTWFFWVDSCKL